VAFAAGGLGRARWASMLASLLLPKLAACAPARVVTVTSGAHSAARLDLSDPNLERGRDSWRSYAGSKLASILFTRELARRLDVSRGLSHGRRS